MHYEISGLSSGLEAELQLLPGWQNDSLKRVSFIHCDLLGIKVSDLFASVSDTRKFIRGT